MVLGRPRGRRQLVARRRGDSGDSGTSATSGTPPGTRAEARGRRVPSSRTPRAALAAAAALEDGGAAVSAPLPSLSLVADADEVSTAEALREHARAIEARFFHPPRDLRTGDAPGDEPGDEPGDDPGTNRAAFSSFRSAWFFALASRVDVPLDADTSAAMRGAARGFAAARAATASEHDPSLPDLQVGLAVAGGYFGQEGA